MAEKFELKGNVRKQKVTFTLAKDSNWQFEIKQFLGEELPEEAVNTFENLYGGVCIAMGSLTSINNSEKAISELKKEVEYQLFSSHIAVGDCTIAYKKGTSNVLELTLDAKNAIDLLLSVSYGEVEEEDAEPEIIY